MNHMNPSLPVRAQQSDPIILEVNISFEPNLASLQIKTSNHKQNVKYIFKTSKNTAIQKIHSFQKIKNQKLKNHIRISTNRAQNPQKTYPQPPKNKIIRKTRTTIKQDPKVVEIISDDESFDQFDHTQNRVLLQEQIQSQAIPIILESDKEQYDTVVQINLEQSDNEQSYQLPDVINSQDSNPEATVAIKQQEFIRSYSNSKYRNLFPDQQQTFKKPKQQTLCKIQKQINSRILVETSKSTKIKSFSQQNHRRFYEEMSRSIKPFEATTRSKNEIALYLKHYARLSISLIKVIADSRIIDEPILTEKIIGEIHNYIQKIDYGEKQLVHLHLLKKALAIFREGIYVPSELVMQQRFDQIDLVPYSSIDRSSEEVHYFQFKPDQNKKLLFRKITFCPSALITGQLFFIINNSIESKIISGHYGVGKTYSYLLYKLLSDNVYCYYYYASSIAKENYRFNMDQTPKKMVYINIQLDSDSEELLQSIKSQCFQMDLAIPNFNFGPQFLNTTRRQFIASFYASNYNIQIFVVVDQINILGRTIKQVQIVSELQQKNQLNKIQAHLKKNRLQSKEELINCEKSLNKIISILKKGFSRILYLSLINIESQIFKSPIFHQRICEQKQELDLNKFISNQSLSHDFASYVHFKIQRINKKQKMKKIKISDIIKQLESKQYIPYIPLHIDQFFKNLKQDISLSQTIQSIFNRCIDGILQKISAFVQKD